MKYYLIKVKGDIVANTCIHYAQEWVCYGLTSCNTNKKSYVYEKDTHSVHSDLILNESRRAVPYAVYLAEKDISVEGPGDISAAISYHAALMYYKENIDKISQLLKCNLPKEIEQTVFYGFYTEVFSLLELFLSDFILCMIYSDETIYEKAVHYYKTSNKCKNEVLEIEKKVHHFFFNGVVYHQFDRVKKIFIKLLGIEFPDATELSKLLHKRNNIVHRFSFSNIDRMTMIEITMKDIVSLVSLKIC